MPVQVQFVINRGDIFRFEEISLLLEPQSKKTFAVTFAAGVPMAYTRRVFCLVEHMEPIVRVRACVGR